MKITIAELLRHPGDFMSRACSEAPLGRTVGFLVLMTCVGFGLLGLAMGFFVGWSVALLDAAKMLGIVFFSYALCLPSLYVFTCFAGSTLSFARTAVMGLVCTSLIGCLLAALAPVIWLFAVSTASVIGFMVLTLILVGVAIGFAGRLMNSPGLVAWFAVLILVALQTVTLLRPMLAPFGMESELKGKCLFIRHFGETIKTECAPESRR